MRGPHPVHRSLECVRAERSPRGRPRHRPGRDRAGRQSLRRRRAAVLGGRRRPRGGPRRRPRPDRRPRRPARDRSARRVPRPARAVLRRGCSTSPTSAPTAACRSSAATSSSSPTRRAGCWTPRSPSSAPTSLDIRRPRASASAAARATAARQVQRAGARGAPASSSCSAAPPRLAWETTVRRHPRRRPHAPDASTSTPPPARCSARKEHVIEGTGTSAWTPAPSRSRTTLSGSTYSMKNPNAATLVCQDAATNATFTGTDDVWGNGDATNRETGCVDALYARRAGAPDAVRRGSGRNGMNGTGGGWPIRVGLNDVNAYYDGTQVQIGHNQTGGQWIGSIDVVAHEFGHGIDDNTPGRHLRQRHPGVRRRHVRRGDRVVRQQPPTDTPRLPGRRGGQPGRQRPDPLHVQPVARRRPQLLLQQRSRPPRCTPRPVPATTGSTCSPRAPTRPTASRPARPATAPRSPASASRRPTEDHVQRDADEDLVRRRT